MHAFTFASPDRSAQPGTGRPGDGDSHPLAGVAGYGRLSSGSVSSGPIA